MGWVVNATPRPFYPREYLVPIVQQAGWAQGPVWTGAENLAPTGVGFDPGGMYFYISTFQSVCAQYGSFR
jgi:hypothetical protein